MSYQNYKELFTEIKIKVREAQLKSVMAANSQMLLLYWQMGQYILQNQQAEGWGAKIINKLSVDLKKEFPSLKGFSPRNLLYMKQFAEAYPVFLLQQFSQIEKELTGMKSISQQAVAKLLHLENAGHAIAQQPVAQLPEQVFLQSIVARISWSHHVILKDKVQNSGQRLWYMLHAIEHGISRNVLAMQIESGLFERQVKAKKINNFQRTLPAAQTDFANYLFKDPYIFDFVQAKEKADERNIEEQLATHITKFLLELGQGFAFLGRHVHFEIGNTDFFVDLLFYHTRLHAYVVVELKARPFKPGDAGQLNFYLNVVNDKLKIAEDRDTIGLLLCKGKNEVLAEYALKGYSHPIGVSDYQISKAIPEVLKSSLPNISDLENELLKEEDRLRSETNKDDEQL
ncbi:MAG: PDDEXK nuclease domain-containing protein [Chitinophagaceae bacterium]|nr:PDDEXK nuclease domain-containing protein [Chitinophagaceae bacterium]